MLISACLIVKNEEKNLLKTLPNLSKLADEIILVDTGSTDNTIAIAKQYNAKVYNFPWINDFAAARNESLKYPKGDWIIIPDADEFIKEEDMNKLKEALKDSKEIAFSLKVSECKKDTFKVISFNLRPKVFKNNIGIHFERPINEQPYTKDGKLVANVAKPLDIPIYHWGGDLEGEEFQNKKMRNITILEKIVEKESGDSAYHFLLGMNYRDLKKYEEAVKEFEKVIQINNSPRFVEAAKTEKAWAHFYLNQAKKAYVEALECLKLNNQNSSAWNVVGAVLIALGDLNKAIEALNDAKNIPIQPDSLIVNLRQKEYVSNMYLAQAYMKKQQFREALEAAQNAYKFEPTKEASEAVNKAMQEKLPPSR